MVGICNFQNFKKYPYAKVEIARDSITAFHKLIKS